MPPKDKRGDIMMRNASKVPRNPAEDALYRLTLAGDLFQEQVLARLDPTDRGMLRLVNRDLRFTVQSRTIRHPWTFKVSDFVGSVERFAWALKNKILGQVPLTRIFVKAIIKGGNLDVLKRAELAIRVYSPDFRFAPADIVTAAKFGQTQIFEWLMDQPALHDEIYAWSRALELAAENGHLDILKVFKARADKYPDDDIWHPKLDDVRKAAVRKGNVEIFEWVLAQGTCEKEWRTFLQEYPIIELLSLFGHRTFGCLRHLPCISV